MNAWAHMRARATNRRASARTKTAFVLLTFLSFGFLVEVGARVHHARKVKRLLGNRLIEGLDTRPTADGRVYELRPGTALTNSAGFRDIERPQTKPKGTFRIAVIGDSVTMQRSIPFEGLYVRHLERLIERWNLGFEVELLNFGITGYSTRQEFILLEQRVLEYHPDAILWQFHDNDSQDPRTSNADGGLVTYYAQPVSRSVEFASRRIRNWRRSRYARREGLSGLPVALIDQHYYWEQFSALFADITATCVARDIPLLIFLYPSWPTGDDWRNYPAQGFAMHDRQMARFRELGLPALDLLPALVRRDASEFRGSPDDPWHPNADGHRWIAEQLTPWLQSELFDPPTGLHPRSHDPALDP